MAGQTDVPITAGSGTDIDAWQTSGTGNYRQAVVIGDPATDANVASITSGKALQVDLGATTANSNKLLVTPDLPTGASTSAKQPALGTAGTASSDVITVQGKSGMTALSTSTTNGALETGGNLATIATNTGNIPASPSTAGNQTTANTSLSTIATNTTNAGTPTLQSGSTTAVTQATASNLNATVTQVSGNWNSNISQINGHTALEGGTNGSLAVGGGVATNVAITTNPVNQGAQAVTTENSAITTGRMAQLVADKVGKLITLPYANPENFVSGLATATGTSDTAVIGAQGAGLFLYITSISVANTGATASLVTIEWDTASAKTAAWYMINPAGGGDNITFPNPLKAPVANKNVGFVAGSSSTTQYVSISGYYGI